MILVSEAFCLFVVLVVLKKSCLSSPWLSTALLFTLEGTVIHFLLDLLVIREEVDH